jgi:hypothetical protein
MVDWTQYWNRLVQIESGGNPNSYNKGSRAAGLAQFIPSTWARYGGGGSPFDPVAAEAATRALTADNAAVLRRSLGREPTMGELYLAHQQGAGGASALLSNPNAPAGSLVGASAVASNGGDPNAPASAFANKWVSRFPGDAPGAGFGLGGIVADASQGLNAPKTMPVGAPRPILPPPNVANAVYGGLGGQKRQDPTLGAGLMARKAPTAAPAQPNLILGMG